MNELVLNQNGQSVTTSRLVADKFGKRHANVIRAIERLETPVEFNQLHFELVEYLDAKGEKRPEYVITRDGFSFLVMGFTGREAAKFKVDFINAFNRMEQRLRSPQPLYTIDLIIESAKRLKETQQLALEAKQVASETRQEIGVIKDRVDLLEVKTTTRPGYFTIAAFAKLNKIKINDNQSKFLGKMAASLCRSLGYPPDKVPDGRFGYVYSYPSSILQETFQKNGLYQNERLKHFN